ncbi:MAG: methyltransferase domain-containing protein [Myxococcales bacterium]|nr:methyltransferase domain-containing protein [Myxococcales bacterium]
MNDFLDLLCCPMTGAGLAFEGAGGEGVLRSTAGTSFPVIGGVPRLLPPDLLGPFLRGAYPEVLAAHPEWAQATAAPDPAVLDTMVGYDGQHVDLADATLLVDDWRATWDRFQPGLPPAAFAGQTVVEVGCGEGRHAFLVGEHAARVVAFDLSRGVEVARRRDGRANVCYVQGDLHRPPLRRGAFDALYSNGVLHHTPDPARAFAAVAPLVKRGGQVSIWVYGLDGMRWSYRLSHLAWLRPLTGRLPRSARLGVAAALTAGAELGLWLPARALRRAGLAGWADRVPFSDAAERDRAYKLRRMYDRLNPPVTHYPDAGELARWFAEFDDVRIADTDGRGWSARGRAGPHVAPLW